MSDADLFLFVIHVSEDRAAALEIVGELERRGVPCWIAPRNVQPGHPFDDEIVAALDRCRAMLLIFSEHCNESEYIRREVTVAGENRKIIIPFRIEDVQPRRGLRVRLSDLHWIDGFAAHERAIDELARRFAPSVPFIGPANKPSATLSDGAGPRSPPARTSTPAPPPQPTSSTRNYLAAIGGVGVLAVAGIAAAVWFWSGGFGAKPTPAPVTGIPADALGSPSRRSGKCHGANLCWVSLRERPGGAPGFSRSAELVSQGRRPGACSGAEEYWEPVRTGLGRDAGLRRGNAVVPIGRRPGKCRRANQYRLPVREGPRRSAGLCRGDALVSQGRRAGRGHRAKQHRRLLR